MSDRLCGLLRPANEAMATMTTRVVPSGHMLIFIHEV